MGYIFVAWFNYFNAYFSVLVIYLKSSKLVDPYCEIAGYAFINEAYHFYYCITNKYLQWNLRFNLLLDFLRKVSDDTLHY